METGNLHGFPTKMIYIHGGFSTFLLVYRRASWISGRIGSFPTILRTPWFWQHWNSSQKTYGFPLFHPLFSPNNGDFSEVVIISLLASTLPLGTKLAALHWIRWLLCYTNKHIRLGGFKLCCLLNHIWNDLESWMAVPFSKFFKGVETSNLLILHIHVRAFFLTI